MGLLRTEATHLLQDHDRLVEGPGLGEAPGEHAQERGIVEAKLGEVPEDPEPELALPVPEEELGAVQVEGRARVGRTLGQVGGIGLPPGSRAKGREPRRLRVPGSDDDGGIRDTGCGGGRGRTVPGPHRRRRSRGCHALRGAGHDAAAVERLARLLEAPAGRDREVLPPPVHPLLPPLHEPFHGALLLPLLVHRTRAHGGEVLGAQRRAIRRRLHAMLEVLRQGLEHEEGRSGGDEAVAPPQLDELGGSVGRYGGELLRTRLGPADGHRTRGCGGARGTCLGDANRALLQGSCALHEDERHLPLLSEEAPGDDVATPVGAAPDLDVHHRPRLPRGAGEPRTRAGEVGRGIGRVERHEIEEAGPGRGADVAKASPVGEAGARGRPDRDRAESGHALVERGDAVGEEEPHLVPRNGRRREVDRRERGPTVRRARPQVGEELRVGVRRVASHRLGPVAEDHEVHDRLLPSRQQPLQEGQFTVRLLLATAARSVPGDGQPGRRGARLPRGFRDQAAQEEPARPIRCRLDGHDPGGELREPDEEIAPHRRGREAGLGDPEILPLGEDGRPEAALHLRPGEPLRHFYSQ